MCVLEMQNLYVLAFLLIKNVEKHFVLAAQKW